VANQLRFRSSYGLWEPCEEVQFWYNWRPCPQWATAARLKKMVRCIKATRLFVFRVWVSLRRLSTSPLRLRFGKYPLAPPYQDFYFKPPTETCTFVMRAFSQSSVNICAGILMILPVHVGAEWKLCFLVVDEIICQTKMCSRGIFSASLRIHGARVEICFCYLPPRADSNVNGKMYIYTRSFECDARATFFIFITSSAA
jgi:hypothetical protein